MNKRFSGIYKYDGFKFRYDFENSLVQYVHKPTKKELAEDTEWFEETGSHLLNLDEDGIEVIDSVGLHRENWKNKEVRDEYLSSWVFDLREEVAWLIRCEEGMI